MPRPDSKLTPLEVRKQLLLVESEVNRAHLLSDCAVMRNHFAAWKAELLSIQSTASNVISGVKTVRDVLTRGKASMVSTLFSAARSGLSMWGNVLGRPR